MDWLKLIATYGPAAFAAVTAVQTLRVPGVTKKQIALDIITGAANVAEKIPEAHVQAIGGLIDVIKGSIKKSGAFEHQTAPTLPMPDPAGFLPRR